jgi:hypothetical protein
VRPPASRLPSGFPDGTDPFPEEELDAYHSPEPWKQDGRYIRDAAGAIVVRGRSYADARRIVASMNATRNIPTEALEGWLVEDVSDPATRPDLEVTIAEEGTASPYLVVPGDRRRADRRQRERRVGDAPDSVKELIFDRRVMERRLVERRSRPPKADPRQ